MLARLLIVVLLILNAGVGLWWWSRPSVTTMALSPASPPEGVPLLALVDDPAVLVTAEQAPDLVDGVESEELVPEEAALAGLEPQTADQTPQKTMDAPVDLAVASVKPAAAPVCVHLSGSADARTAVVLRRQLGDLVSDWREQPVQATASTWRVLIPPAADRQTAEQMATRIAAAGFSDWFVVNQGELLHAVALGQFRNRDGAKRRLDALVAAGFPAVMQPSQPAATSPWRAVARLAEGAGLQQLRTRVGEGITTESIDCSALR